MNIFSLKQSLIFYLSDSFLWPSQTKLISFIILNTLCLQFAYFWLSVTLKVCSEHGWQDSVHESDILVSGHAHRIIEYDELEGTH